MKFPCIGMRWGGVAVIAFVAMVTIPCVAVEKLSTTTALSIKTTISLGVVRLCCIPCIKSLGINSEGSSVALNKVLLSLVGVILFEYESELSPKVTINHGKSQHGRKEVLNSSLNMVGKQLTK